MTKSVNWIGVLCAVVATYLLGWAWYDALFGAQWMALQGITKEEIAQEAMLPALLLGLLVQILVMTGLGFAIRKVGQESWAGGAKVGLFSAVFFALTTSALNYIYRSDPVALTAIDFGYLLAIYVLGGALIGGVKLKPKA